MPASDVIRVAVAGYGLAGEVFHAPLVSATVGMQVSAVVTGDPERQARARAAYPETTVFGRLEELLQEAAAFDLVVVATPTGTHSDVATRALRSGLGVVVDKPVGTNAAEARQVRAAAVDVGGWLSVFHNRRWDSETLTTRRLLNQGRLGRVFRFESRFERWRPQLNLTSWRDSQASREGGGALLDLGSHLVDQATHLFGSARTVYGEVRTTRPGAIAEDDVFIAITHQGGVVSHLWASAVAGQRGPSVRVLGLEGTYVKERLDGQEDALRRGELPGAPGWGLEPESEWGRVWTGEAGEAVETEAGDWPAYYRLVVESLRTGAPPPVTPDQAVAVMDILDAARLSETSGEVVDLKG